MASARARPVIGSSWSSTISLEIREIPGQLTDSPSIGRCTTYPLRPTPALKFPTLAAARPVPPHKGEGLRRGRRSSGCHVRIGHARRPQALDQRRAALDPASVKSVSSVVETFGVSPRCRLPVASPAGPTAAAAHRAITRQDTVALWRMASTRVRPVIGSSWSSTISRPADVISARASASLRSR